MLTLYLAALAVTMFTQSPDESKPSGSTGPEADETDELADLCSAGQDAAKAGWTKRRLSSECRRRRRQLENSRIEAIIENEERSFRGAMKHARRARCATAVCWGPSHMWALEPLVELPVGKTFSVPGSSLAQYMNSNELQVSFNAGVRFWMWWDWVSVSMYMSKVLITGNDAIKTTTSGTALPVSQMRRPFPGVGIGLFADLLWLSVDYDQLRNGNSPTTKSPDFPANTLVSHAFTFTVAIAPIAGIRNGLGTLVEQRRKKEQDGGRRPPKRTRPRIVAVMRTRRKLPNPSPSRPRRARHRLPPTRTPAPRRRTGTPAIPRRVSLQPRGSNPT